MSRKYTGKLQVKNKKKVSIFHYRSFPLPQWLDDGNFITFALVDYAGLANEYIKTQTGHSLGTKVTGRVLERKFRYFLLGRMVFVEHGNYYQHDLANIL